VRNVLNLADKIKTLSPEQIAEVEDFVDFFSHGRGIAN